MMDSLEGYLNNIAAVATQTVDHGGPLAELASSLAVSLDTVARQQQDIKRLKAQVNAFKNKGPQETSGKEMERMICKHYEAVGRTAPHGKIVSLTPKK